jgi:hypothetical protein
MKVEIDANMQRIGLKDEGEGFESRSQHHRGSPGVLKDL